MRAATLGKPGHSADKQPDIVGHKKELQTKRRKTKKPHVILGNEEFDSTSVSPLPETSSLSGLLKTQGLKLNQYILNSNTFIQGKVGLYELLIRMIYKIGAVRNKNITYLSTASELRSITRLPRLILLPKVKSEESLNDFVAQSLRNKTGAPVWLIANPLSVYKHLLLGFKNFFIASQREDEISYLKIVLNIPHEFEILLSKNETGIIFITDFHASQNDTLSPTTVVRIKELK